MPHHYNAGPRDEKMPSVTREGKEKKNGKVTGIGPVASGEEYGTHLKKIKSDKAAKRKANLKKAATIVSGLSDLAGHLKDPGLDYTPSATPVRSGASKGASYIGSFDEYNTEDAAGRK